MEKNKYDGGIGEETGKGRQVEFKSFVTTSAMRGPQDTLARKIEREDEMKEARNALVARQTETITRPIDLLPISLQGYFKEIKASNEALAQVILDFLTELRMYDQALYQPVDAASNVYEAARSEEEVISDLMAIKKKLLADAGPLITKGLDELLEA